VTGGGNNGPVFVNFAAISDNLGRGLTKYMTATDSSGAVATLPRPGSAASWPSTGRSRSRASEASIDFGKITRLDVTFVYPVTNTGRGWLLVQVNKIWATPISGSAPTPPGPSVTAPADAIGVAGTPVDFKVSFRSNEGAAPVTYNPPSSIGLRAQDLTVGGTAFGGATP
jgi:hypothetical protein